MSPYPGPKESFLESGLKIVIQASTQVRLDGATLTIGVGTVDTDAIDVFVQLIHSLQCLL